MKHAFAIDKKIVLPANGNFVATAAVAAVHGVKVVSFDFYVFHRVVFDYNLINENYTTFSNGNTQINEISKSNRFERNRVKSVLSSNEIESFNRSRFHLLVFAHTKTLNESDFYWCKIVSKEQ